MELLAGLFQLKQAGQENTAGEGPEFTVTDQINAEHVQISQGGAGEIHATQVDIEQENTLSRAVIRLTLVCDLEHYRIVNFPGATIPKSLTYVLREDIANAVS